jgi:plastocyanin
MNAERTSLVNKLILFVLLLILACLVVLIARQSGPGTDAKPSPVALTGKEEDSAALEPPKHLPLTSGARRRTVAPIPEPPAGEVAQLPSASQPEAASPVGASQPVAALVNLPPRPSSDTGTSTGGAGAKGAEISGCVWLTGTPPPETRIALDAACGRLQGHPITTRHYIVSDDGRLADVFVYVRNGLENKRFSVSTNVEVLDNINCLFEPQVLGVQAGQKIDFRNSDPLLHNVHATTRINQDFNVALSAKNQSFVKVFRVPEVFVRVKCDVHPWMFAYIGVVSHPFFAVTDGEGVYRLPPHLPPGNYTVVASHPKAGEVSQDITVRKGESLRLDFTLAVPSGP